MNGSICLRRLYNTFDRKLSRISVRVQIAQNAPYPASYDCIARSTIDALNYWNSFLRAYYCSYIVKAKRMSRVSRLSSATQIVNMDHAVGLAWQVVNPRMLTRRSLYGPWTRREEPAWHDMNNFLNILNHIGANNYADIQNAFSTGSRAPSDLVVFRNYFAHRNQATFRSAIQLAHANQVIAGNTPANALLSRPLGRPTELFIEWIYDLIGIGSLMCN